MFELLTHAQNGFTATVFLPLCKNANFVKFGLELAKTKRLEGLGSSLSLITCCYVGKCCWQSIGLKIGAVKYNQLTGPTSK